MSYAVRCPSCRGLSRVGPAAVGRVVACPACSHRFRAEPLPPPPVAAPLPADPELLVPDDGPSGVLLGLALLPLGIPPAWLAGRLLFRAEPVFSLAAPLAVGLGVCGLAVGVGLVRGWSHAARVRWVLALVAAGYLAGGLLFAVQKEWAAVGRRLFGPAAIRWGRFEPPGNGYVAQVPDGAAVPAAAGPVDGWDLRTFTAEAGQPDDRRRVWAVRYTLADGVPPTDPKLADDIWFAAVRDAVVAASGGELTAETPVRVGDKPARELWLTLPDRLTHRVVRLVRSGDRLVYAAAEGLFLAADRNEVTHFLGGLAVK